MTLGLHRATHYPECRPQFPGIRARSQTGNDRVQGTLAGREGVRVTLHQPERVAPVLEAHAGPVRHDAATEAHVEAVYKRATVPLRVHGAKIRGVVAERRSDGGGGAGRGYPLAQGGGVVFRGQLIRRDFPELRVANLLVEVPGRRVSSPRLRGGCAARPGGPGPRSRSLRGC